MYARGQQDKAAGMSESDARRTAEAIKQQAAQGTRTEHAFTGNASDKWDNAMENKDAVLFGNELRCLSRRLSWGEIILRPACAQRSTLTQRCS